MSEGMKRISGATGYGPLEILEMAEEERSYKERYINLIDQMERLFKMVMHGGVSQYGAAVHLARDAQNIIDKAKGDIIKCPTCDGTGKVHSHNPKCWECNGSGYIREV